MSDDLDAKIQAALRAIPKDTDVTARLVTKLGDARRPIGTIWLVGGAAVAGIAGFAAALLQGPVTTGGADTLLFFLGGAI